MAQSLKYETLAPVPRWVHARYRNGSSARGGANTSSRNDQPAPCAAPQPPACRSPESPAAAHQRHYGAAAPTAAARAAGSSPRPAPPARLLARLARLAQRDGAAAAAAGAGDSSSRPASRARLLARLTRLVQRYGATAAPPPIACGVTRAPPCPAAAAAAPRPPPAPIAGPRRRARACRAPARVARPEQSAVAIVSTHSCMAGPGSASPWGARRRTRVAGLLRPGSGKDRHVWPGSVAWPEGHSRAWLLLPGGACRAPQAEGALEPEETAQLLAQRRAQQPALHAVPRARMGLAIRPGAQRAAAAAARGRKSAEKFSAPYGGGAGRAPRTASAAAHGRGTR